MVLMVHGFDAEGYNGDVTVVLAAVVLVAKEFAEKFGIVVTKRVWDVGLEFVGKPFSIMGRSMLACLRSAWM